MNRSTAIVVYFMIACLLGIFAFMFFEPARKNRRSLLMSFYVGATCVMTFNYAMFLLVGSSKLTRILFSLHTIFTIVLSYALFIFIMFLTNVKNSRIYKILALLGIASFFVSYVFFPFTDVLDTTHKISWRIVISNVARYPSFLIFVAYLSIVSFLNVMHLLAYYKSKENIMRMRVSCLVLACVLILVLIMNIINYVYLYFFNVVSFYYDLLVITVFLFSCAAVFVQYSFYVLDISPNELINKIVNRLPECVAVVDSDLNLIWWNKMFEKFFPSVLKQKKNISIKHFVMSDCPDSVFKGKAKFKTNCQIRDSEREILFTCLPIYSSNGDFISGVYYIQDITALEKRKEKILHRKKILENKIMNKMLSIKRANIKLKNLISEKIKQEENNFFLLNFDKATKLYNRKTITQKLTSLISKQEILYVIYLDIDDAKILNDSFGHDTIDKLIVDVANRLTNNFEYDNVIARFSGDEFLIVLSERTHIQNTCANLLDLLSMPFYIDKSEIKITVSIGVSIFPNDGVDAGTLIRFANMAMYNAKEKGKNCISYFDSSLKNKIETEFFISEKLKNEVLSGNMNVLVEPIININTDGSRHIDGFETCLCWYYNLENFLDENLFAEMIRKAGIQKKFDRWLINSVMKKASESEFFRKTPDFKVMVALSDESFFSPIFVDYILETINAYNIKPDRLEVEIMEETLMMNPELSIKNINQCQQFGIGVTIKNFGVSYSSLNRLNKLTFNQIKISKAFISEIGKNLKDEGIIKLLILLSSRTNMDVIAEGVDYTMQFRFLIQNGCRKFQGDFFSHPMLVDDFLHVLDSDSIVI